MNTHNSERLDVWMRACRLAMDVSAAFHPLKDQALKSRVQRSAISIPSHIAEGAERRSRRHFLRLLGYSMESCTELQTQLAIHLQASRGLSLEPELNLLDLIEDARELAWMLGSLIQRIEREGDS